MRYELKYNAVMTMIAEINVVGDVAYISFQNYDIVYSQSQDSIHVKGIVYNKELYKSLYDFLIDSINDAFEHELHVQRSLDLLLGVDRDRFVEANERKLAVKNDRNMFEVMNRLKHKEH